ncbi:MAG: hypothetical protein MI785_19955 [Kiloniellales bacterium]|nr:hypothetical protein [Kiloniellales bacterium]
MEYKDPPSTAWQSDYNSVKCLQPLSVQCRVFGRAGGEEPWTTIQTPLDLGSILLPDTLLSKVAHYALPADIKQQRPRVSDLLIIADACEIGKCLLHDIGGRFRVSKDRRKKADELAKIIPEKTLYFLLLFVIDIRPSQRPGAGGTLPFRHSLTTDLLFTSTSTPRSSFLSIYITNNCAFPLIKF